MLCFQLILWLGLVVALIIFMVVNRLAARALKLACERLADSPQSYEEARAAADWARHFIQEAAAEMKSINR